MPYRLMLILFLLITPTIHALEFSALVIGVSDGDTITVLEETNGVKSSFKVRLDAIDAPERGQAFGDKAKEYLAELVFQKTVTVNFTKIDRYGRMVARITVEETNVNLAMLTAGMAWHYKQYDNTPEYADAEAKARAEKIGLWVDNEPMSPAEFRHKK